MFLCKKQERVGGACSTHTIQSTASMRDRSLVGSPMASRMMAMVRTPPAGTPAAPTLDAVAVTLQSNIHAWSEDSQLSSAALCHLLPSHGNCKQTLQHGTCGAFASQANPFLPADAKERVQRMGSAGIHSNYVGMALGSTPGLPFQDKKQPTQLHPAALLTLPAPVC